MTKQLIEIKMPKCTLFFTQQELQQLLARDPALWTKALRRGKHILRQRKEAARRPKGGDSMNFGRGP